MKYLNKHIHMYTKYGLPIWLTEFACGFEAAELNEDGQVRGPRANYQRKKSRPPLHRQFCLAASHHRAPPASIDKGRVACDVRHQELSPAPDSKFYSSFLKYRRSSGWVPFFLSFAVLLVYYLLCSASFLGKCVCVCVCVLFFRHHICFQCSKGAFATPGTLPEHLNRVIASVSFQDPIQTRL